MSDVDEGRNQKIIDAISKKESFTIDVSNKCDENGQIEINLNPAFQPKRDASFRISLIDFATTNLIANVDMHNNKFYYNNGSADKVATIPIGFYSIKGYNGEIKRILKENGDHEDGIDITINKMTGIVNIKLTRGYSVLFNRENTFRESLGFVSALLQGDNIHLASRICRLWPTQRIYIHCSAVRGNRKVTINGCVNSDIIYRFPCNQRYGAPITYQLGPRLTERDLNLSSGEVDRITIRFTNDNGIPVTFGGTQVDLSLRISKV